MKQVTIPAQWLQELIALCGPEDHELRERVMKSAAPAPVDALATGGQAQAVEQAPVLYVSKGQLDNHRDPDGPDSANAGRYLPCRITPAGKFTTPLFAAPQAQAVAQDAGLGTARAFIEWVKAQPEDREQTAIDGALVEFEAHIAAIAAAKGK